MNKMSLKKVKAILIISGVVLVAGIVWNSQSEPRLIRVSRSTEVAWPADELFDFLTHPDIISQWFPWISHFKSADSKFLMPSKYFQAFYTLPLIGEKSILFELEDFVPGKLFKLVPLSTSSLFLVPEITLTVSCLSNVKSHLKVTMVFHHRSFLFQHSLGRFIKMITKKSLKSSLKMVKHLQKMN